ncbi:MAG TPA: 2-hydroxyacid dehydrogenase [Caulobacteraceae bacterium]|jgi:lactate dehydrogenase-like 2-hydroxyacid dehydrogenase|nr:2-hydroxyacid dehydrogenase [Caulobacteraceae bacterium]
MTDKPAILIMQKLLGPIGLLLEQSYTVYRFWEGPPAEAAHNIRILMVVGEFELDKALIESLPNLGLIAVFTSGYDRVDVAWARGRGLKLSHAPATNHEEVADMALGLLIGARRQIVQGDREIRAGEWIDGKKTLTHAMRGQKTGIVGLGLIGQDLAKRCELLGMEVRWWGPRPKPDAAWPRADSLLDLAKWCDNLVITAKVDASNTGLISRDVIEAVGPEGLIVNVSRGQIIDEDAIIAALKAGTLGAAALDVFVEEPTPYERWRDVPNTILTPHTAGATTDSVQRMVALLLQNLTAFLEDKPLVTPIPE